jgi:hypothetical protein
MPFFEAGTEGKLPRVAPIREVRHSPGTLLPIGNLGRYFPWDTKRPVGGVPDLSSSGRFQEHFILTVLRLK